jgi:hypothetical protein
VASLPERAAQIVGGTAARGKWIARGAWVLALAEIAILVKDHLDRLDGDERRRLVEIVSASKGRPANLSRREKAELKRLVDKIDPKELATGIATRATGFGGKR